MADDDFHQIVARGGGEPGEVIRAELEALADAERGFGAEHPEAAGARTRLALAHEEAGRLEQAIPLLERALGDRERIQGERHPDTLPLRCALGRAYRESGRAAEAISLLERAVADGQRVLGDDDAKTWAARDALASAYKDVGREDEALVLYERNLHDRERVLGTHDPATLTARGNVGLTYRELGRFDDAIAVLTAVVVGRRRVFGADHPALLRSRNHLALAYEDSGSLDDAIAGYERTLADCTRVLGIDHELTETVRFNLAEVRRRIWEPEYDVERRLAEAKGHGDAEAYLRLLGDIDLFVLAGKRRGDFAEDAITWTPCEENGHTQVFTRGAATYRPGAVYLMRSLVWLGEQECGVIVNRGLPAVEWSFPADALAKAVADRAGEGPRGPMLLTRDAGPVDGPLAFGLACGAPLAVRDRAPWNDIGVAYGDYIDGRRALRDGWGVTTADEWRAAVESLLSGDSGNGAATIALELRRASAPGHERYLDPADWQETIAQWCRARYLAPDVTRRLVDLAALITRYEERFRADGLLTRDGFVHSVLAYDIGRAVTMARWGVEAGFCDERGAERHIVRAGEQARRSYSWWRSFGAGYAMGHVLRAGEGATGERYEGMVSAHRVLSGDPASPWRTIAW